MRPGWSFQALETVYFTLGSRPLTQLLGDAESSSFKSVPEQEGEVALQQG